ncbi:MAG: hypothetical protein ACOYO1_09555 [Bacteroidales bacterium]
MNIICIFNCWDPCQTISIIITLIVAILPYIVIYSLRNNLEIVCASYDKSEKNLRIKVVNNGRFDAVNIRIEACAYDEENKFTYHFKIDHSEFLNIKGDKKKNDTEKIFKSDSISETAKNYGETFDSLIAKINSDKYKLRIRIHSYHSFSGLGKAIEKELKLKEKCK